MPRPDRNTETAVKQEFYSDFSVDFSKNPITGALARLTNEDSVKQSIKILVFSMLGEWPHANRLGCAVHKQLFEMADDITASVMQTTVTEVLKKYEPRIGFLKVNIINDADNHQYTINILFTLQNTTGISSVNMILKRIR
jgi:phage baseplate assembly protein W